MDIYDVSILNKRKAEGNTPFGSVPVKYIKTENAKPSDKGPESTVLFPMLPLVPSSASSEVPTA